MPTFFQDGTTGILLANDDLLSWAESLVFAFEMCNPPNTLMSVGCLPEEQENMLSTILLPV